MKKNSSAGALTVGALAKAAGVGVETVRYYQRRGLLGVPEGNGSYRRYGSDHLERLQFIRRAQAIGFTLKETAELLALNDMRDHRLARSLALEKIDDLVQRIDHLDRMADALRHLVRECERGEGHAACPIIRLALGHDASHSKAGGRAPERSASRN